MPLKKLPTSNKSVMTEKKPGKQLSVDDLMLNGGAEFSDCRKYRYKLWRIWDANKPLIAFMGINPSTANETEPDNTIKRVISIAKSNGFGGIYMINLFGLVSTDPDLLLTHPDPLGDNDRHIDEVQGLVSGIVCAWGAFGQAKQRAREVYPRIGNPLTLLVLKDGSPKHPLYCKKDTVLLPFTYNQNPQQ